MESILSVLAMLFCIVIFFYVQKSTKNQRAMLDLLSKIQDQHEKKISKLDLELGNMDERIDDNRNDEIEDISYITDTELPEIQRQLDNLQFKEEYLKKIVNDYGNLKKKLDYIYPHEPNIDPVENLKKQDELMDDLMQESLDRYSLAYSRQQERKNNKEDCISNNASDEELDKDISEKQPETVENEDSANDSKSLDDIINEKHKSFEDYNNQFETTEIPAFFKMQESNPDNENTEILKKVE